MASSAIRLVRTNSNNSDFVHLVEQLDAELMAVDGEDHAFYAQFHQTALLEYCIVAYQTDIPVACGAIKAYSTRQVEIKRMYTLPRFRGLGIAGKVLSELEVWAKELRFQSCILETGKRQPQAIAAYSKGGYKIISNYGPYTGVDNSVCFEKKL